MTVAEGVADQLSIAEAAGDHSAPRTAVRVLVTEVAALAGGHDLDVVAHDVHLAIADGVDGHTAVLGQPLAVFVGDGRDVDGRRGVGLVGHDVGRAVGGDGQAGRGDEGEQDDDHAAEDFHGALLVLECAESFCKRLLPRESRINKVILSHTSR